MLSARRSIRSRLRAIRGNLRPDPSTASPDAGARTIDCQSTLGSDDAVCEREHYEVRHGFRAASFSMM
jgi:hypothetical protein